MFFLLLNLKESPKIRKITVYHFSISFLVPELNIGIVRMTGEVTDRFNEITLFGMALFWQKAIEFKIYNSFPHI